MNFFKENLEVISFHKRVVFLARQLFIFFSFFLPSFSFLACSFFFLFLFFLF